MRTRVCGSLILAAMWCATAVACSGDRERTYYTPPTRSPAAVVSATASSAAASLPTRTATPDPRVLPTPYPTPAGPDAAASRARALQVCPEANLDRCVSSFLIIDSGTYAGLLCVMPNGEFWYEMESGYLPVPPSGAFTRSRMGATDRGVGVPCYHDRTATSVALVGGRG